MADPADDTPSDPSPVEDSPSPVSSPSSDPAETTGETAHTTDRRTLDASVQIIWAVRVLVGVAVLTALAGFGASRLGIDPMLVLSGAGLLAVVGLVWVHFRYRVWSFRVRDDALYLERGVFTHVRTVAPHVRIQHVDTSRGPLERALGLSTLVVYTAGSRGADVSIPGLTPEEAADLQRRVKELAIAAEGGDAL